MPPKGSHMVARAPPPDAPLTPAGVQQKAYATSISDLELPKTSLVKLAKGSIPDNVKMQQDVVHALMRSSTLFINYLTSAAHDQALSRAGKQITAGDVIKAITEMDFGPADALVPILEQELAAFRSHAAAVKASKAKPPGPGRGRRRKSAVDQAEGEGDVSMAADGDEDEDDDDEAEEGEGEGEDGEEGDDGEEDEVDDAA